jgi:hypothetical protein
MVKIPGYVFIGFGAILSISSYFINLSNGKNSLTMFIYLGYLFIAYGVAKLLINFILKPEKKSVSGPNFFGRSLPEQDNANMSKESNLRTQQPPKLNPQQKNDLYSYTHQCRKCGTPMRRINIFCHRCGMKQ